MGAKFSESWKGWTKSITPLTFNQMCSHQIYVYSRTIRVCYIVDIRCVMGKYREGLTNIKKSLCMSLHMNIQCTYIINKNQNTLKLPQN